ncbi:MAG: M28 family peptidase [Defluviitaleaceae bacterium]|nr:M28 family peptidase [Defluviitaleaceae bacterium]
MKKAIALLLVVLMAAMPMTVFAENSEPDRPAEAGYVVFEVVERVEVIYPFEESPFRRVENGQMYVALRAAAENLGLTVEWDAYEQAAIINEIYSFDIAGAGGFIEDGTAWVPVEFAEAVLMRILRGTPTPRVERLDLTIWNAENFTEIREPAFPSTDVPHGEISVYYIRYMNDNLPGRSAFTYRELEAAIWIVEELLAMGHEWDNIEIQEFTYWDILEGDIGDLMTLSWSWVTSPMILGVDREYLLRPDRVSQNVVLTLPGQSERKIIVGAHYDSPPYPSASDNASGTALLMESAQRMLEIDHYYTIVYVFFGAEEVGLIGAFYYLEMLTPAQAENIVFMINADVIIEGPYLIYGTGAIPVLTEDDATDMRLAILEDRLEMMVEQFEFLMASREEWAREIAREQGVAYYEVEIFWAFETLEEFLELIAEDLEAMSIETLLLQSIMLGTLLPEVTPAAALVSKIAAELSATRDFNLISIPEAASSGTDSLAFFMAGHTVVNLVGLERRENIPPELAPYLLRAGEGFGDFALTILHTPFDDFDIIEYFWPGMMAANLYGFNVFLEAMLTAGSIG